MLITADQPIQNMWSNPKFINWTLHMILIICKTVNMATSVIKKRDPGLLGSHLRRYNYASVFTKSKELIYLTSHQYCRIEISELYRIILTSRRGRRNFKSTIKWLNWAWVVVTTASRLVFCTGNLLMIEGKVCMTSFLCSLLGKLFS